MTFYLYTAHLIPLFDHFQSTIYHLVQEASSLVTSFINAYPYKNNINCDLGFLSKKPLAMQMIDILYEPGEFSECFTKVQLS